MEAIKPRRDHINRLQYEDSKEEMYLGVEYWVQIRGGKVEHNSNSTGNEESSGLEFHFDKDEELLKARDQWRHPLVSTATYLDPFCSNKVEKSNSESKARGNDVGDRSLTAMSTWGAPLVIFSTISSNTDDSNSKESDECSYPSHGWVVLPIPYTHVSFNGNLLHGVPSELIQQGCLYQEKYKPKKAGINNRGSTSSANTAVSESTGGYEYSRISLLVNIWTGREKPAGVDRISPTLLAPKTNTIESESCVNSSYFNNDSMRSLKMSQLDILSMEEEPYTLSEHVPGDTEILPLAPIHKILEKCRRCYRKHYYDISGCGSLFSKTGITPEKRSGLDDDVNLPGGLLIHYDNMREYIR